MAALVTSADRRDTLAVASLRDADEGRRKRGARTAPSAPGGGADAGEPMREVILPLASGDRTEVRLVLRNNGPADRRPAVRVGGAKLTVLGPTPHLWTRAPRVLVRGVQKLLFRTRIMLPLVAAGIALLVLSGRRRALVVVLAVPLYYMCTQSALHTEYRYILVIHYFLFIAAGLALHRCGAAVFSALATAVRHAGPPPRPAPPERAT